MKKFEQLIERFLVPIAAKLNAQRHVCAVRDSFVLAFPLTMAGSLTVLLNYVLLSPDGFIAKLLKLGTLIPNLAEYQAIFTPVLRGSLDILALLIVFLTGRNLAKSLRADDLLVGLTSISVYFIVYPPYASVEGGNHLSMRFMGAQGLFVAILIGLVVGEIMSRLSKSSKLEIKMPEQVPPAVARTFKLLIPIVITTVGFSILNFVILKFAEGGIHQLVYNIIQKPLTNLGTNVFSIMAIAAIQELLWSMGIHGPNTLAGIVDPMFAEANAANLRFATEMGTTWGVPFPVTYAGLNDAYANYGGSGMTLGLIIAILIFGIAKEQRNIAKLSLAPGLFNINESVIFGLPIVLNPIFIIPFILVPVTNIFIANLFINVLKWVPPVGFSVPWTTPGPLIPFLGTGGNFFALLLGCLCLTTSVLIYAPFVIASNKATNQALDSENEEIVA